MRLQQRNHLLISACEEEEKKKKKCSERIWRREIPLMAYMQNGPSWLSPGNEKSQIYILTEIYSTVILDHAWRLAGKMNFTAAM
jgi:hypothetical protein